MRNTNQLSWAINKDIWPHNIYTGELHTAYVDFLAIKTRSPSPLFNNETLDDDFVATHIYMSFETHICVSPARMFGLRRSGQVSIIFSIIFSTIFIIIFSRENFE